MKSNARMLRWSGASTSACLVCRARAPASPAFEVANQDQLVELAVRALSPDINDPGTARLCIDRLEHALCHLGGRRFPSPARHDDDGRVRVFACPPTFASIVESAFDEIVRYGRSSVSVTCRLLEAVRGVGSCVRREADRRALLRQAAAIAGRFANPHSAKATASGLPDAIVRPSPRYMSHPTIRCSAVDDRATLWKPSSSTAGSRCCARRWWASWPTRLSSCFYGSQENAPLRK